jgi:hypothetical protein
MNELPLSKFAPFTKTEASFQLEVSNKLKELNVKCSNCIYFENPVNGDNPSLLYNCTVLTKQDPLVSMDSLCRFFTNMKEIKDNEEVLEKEDTNIDNQEMSTEIQKLDFHSSNINDSIKQLRENFINE